MSMVDLFDLAMVLVVVFFAVKGVFRGFINELFSLLGLFAGLYFGFHYADTVDALLLEWLPVLNATLSRIVAVALIFFVVCVICALVGKLFSMALHAAALGTLDRFCGLLAGAAKGAAVVAIVVVVLSRMERILPVSFLEQSRVSALMNGVLPHVERYIDQVFPKSSESR